MYKAIGTLFRIRKAPRENNSNYIEGGKGGYRSRFTKNKSALSQFTKNNNGISRFTRKKSFFWHTIPLHFEKLHPKQSLVWGFHWMSHSVCHEWQLSSFSVPRRRLACRQHWDHRNQNLRKSLRKHFSIMTTTACLVLGPNSARKRMQTLLDCYSDCQQAVNAKCKAK